MTSEFDLLSEQLKMYLQSLKDLSCSCSVIEEKYKYAAQVSDSLRAQCEELRSKSMALNMQLLQAKQELLNIKQIYEQEKVMYAIQAQQEMAQKQSFLTTLDIIANQLAATEQLLSVQQKEWETKASSLQKERDDLLEKTSRYQETMQAMLRELEELEGKCSTMAQMLQERKERSSNKDEKDDAAIELTKLKIENGKLQAKYTHDIKHVKADADTKIKRLEQQINNYKSKTEKEHMKKEAQEYFKNKLSKLLSTKGYYGFEYNANPGGLVVGRVRWAGPSEYYGLKEGDLIERINNQDMKNTQDVKAVISGGTSEGPRVGDKLSVLIKRDGKPLEKTIEAGAHSVPPEIMKKIRGFADGEFTDEDYAALDILSFYTNK